MTAPETTPGTESGGEDLVPDSLLRSFQLLQMHTSHVTSRLASSLGIGSSELRLLFYIASSEGVTPKGASDFLDLTSGTITTLVDRVVAAGLIIRVPNPRDRRSLILELAPDGEAAIEQITGVYRRAFSASIAAEDMELIGATFLAVGESLAKTTAEALAQEKISLRRSAVSRNNKAPAKRP